MKVSGIITYLTENNSLMAEIIKNQFSKTKLN